MYANLVHKKLQQFAIEEISLNEFEIMLGMTSDTEPMYIWWTTNEGNKRRYSMYWDSAAYVGGSAGGSDTKAAEGMYNLQGDYPGGDWRTLDTNTVTRFSWRGKSYRIR